MLFTDKGQCWGDGDEGCPQTQNSTRAEVREGALGTLEHFADVEEEHPANRCWAILRRRPRRILSCSQGPVEWKVQGYRSRCSIGRGLLVVSSV